MTFSEHTAVDDRTFCAVHPTVETSLRCNKCGRYMCVKCAVRTPVGYRCKECVHQQQDSYFSASQRDYIIGAAVSFALSIPISYVLTRIGGFGFFFTILLSLPAGGMIGEAVFRAVGKRRGRYLWIVVGVGIVLGALVVTFPFLQQIWSAATTLSEAGQEPASMGGTIFRLLLPTIIYVVLCAGAAMARLRYGK